MRKTNFAGRGPVEAQAEILAKSKDQTISAPGIFTAEMLIHHITLCTGHVATHRLDTLDPAAVSACRELLPAGGLVPGFTPFRVEIHAPVFTLYRGREPLAVCGFGFGGNGTWETLVKLQVQFLPVKASAPKGQWLAVALLPPLAALTPSDVGWLGDFERCLAAAMLLPDRDSLR